MPDMKGECSAKHPEKVLLALPPVYQGKGSYTETPRGYRDIQISMPGSRSKSIDVIQVDTTALPQPFLDPTVFRQWQTKS
ncbi:uncharacterized protein CTRU02_209841 [Colletotrichum truncatum]|uniref:Uncharacterized protein n=1 Tax=Colletotrichum truncatum TaxID=5467 RepID=A0ACC3YTM3_COLTU|nr:uncharacterized protein CTRU02_02413 [Colletotrichum truncatum]KAF6798439.1 hypothetical protein CTRU02_02413 [Colletotrichum truncatum]